MRMSWWSGVCAVLVGAVAFADDPQPKEINLLTVAPPGATTGQLKLIAVQGGDTSGAITVEPTAGLFAFFDAGAEEQSPHWIGLGCSTATDALRSQLGLTETGVVVHDVVADSPAQKAGFQLHDVLLKAVVAEKAIELKEAEQIVQAVKEADLKPIKLELLRKGKPLTLEVTPAERPQPQHRITLTATHPKGVMIDPERVQQLLGEGKLDELKAYIAQQAKELPLNVRYHAAGPVITTHTDWPVPYKVAVTAEVADDLSLTITKSGKQPAEIKVQKGEQSWTVSEKELDKLPDDVRPSVQARLAQLNANAAQAGVKHFREALTKRTAKGPVSAAIPQPPGAPVAPTPAREFGVEWKHLAAHDQALHQQALAQERKALQEAQAAQQQQLQAVQKQLEELKQLVEKLANKP
jgi:hypothetical protein